MVENMATFGNGMTKLMNKEQQEFWENLSLPVDYNDRLNHWIKKSKEQGRMTERLGEEIVRIVDEYMQERPHINPSSREDMKSNAIEKVCRYYERCDTTDPYFWITSIVEQSCIQYVTRQSRQI